jgi:hypothetical protein
MERMWASIWTWESFLLLSESLSTTLRAKLACSLSLRRQRKTRPRFPLPRWRRRLRWRRWSLPSEEMLVAALMAAQCGWGRLYWGVVVVVVVEVEVEGEERRDSLKLRVKLLRAKLLRALEQAKVRSLVVEAEVQLVKLRSRSEYEGKWVYSSSIAAMGCCLINYEPWTLWMIGCVFIKT